jgi:MFS family permease
MLAGFYLAAQPSARGLERLIAVAPAVLGCGLIALSLSRSFALSLALMPVMGMGQMLVMASSNTVLQTLVDEDKRGRVMSFYVLSFMGMLPLGNLMAGVLANQIGAPFTVAIGGSLCIAGALAFGRRLPALRRLMQRVYVGPGVEQAEREAGAV